MEKLEVVGLDELIKAFDRISEVPDEIVNKALLSMADVASDKIRSSGRSLGVYDAESNIHILDKIKIGKPKRKKSGGYANITFSGSRKRGNTRTRNAAIAFINEFGKKNQPARPFIGNAMKKNDEAIVRAGAEIIYNWLEKDYTK